MDAATFFKWNSQASKSTVLVPLAAVAITAAFFLLYIFDESSVSVEVFDRVSELVLSIIVCVVDVILILLMLLFQPTKKRIIKPAAEKVDKKTVVVSAETDSEPEEEEADDAEEVRTESGEKELKEVSVTTAAEKEDAEVLEKGLAAEMSEEPELEAVPEDIDIEEVEEPKQHAMVKDVLTFPESVGGGIFADTYVNVGNGTTLKLRQEVVEEIYLIG